MLRTKVITALFLCFFFFGACGQEHSHNDSSDRSEKNPANNKQFSQQEVDLLFEKLEEKLDEHIREKYVTTPYHIDLMGWVAFIFTTALGFAAYENYQEKKKIKKLREKAESKIKELNALLGPLENDLKKLTVSSNQFLGQSMGKIAMILFTHRVITPEVYEKLDLVITEALIFAPDIVIRRQALLKIRARGTRSVLESLNLIILNPNETEEVKKWALEAVAAINLRGR